MRIALGADHGGFEVKEALKEALEERGVTVEDCGAHGTESVDYPDFAACVAGCVSRGRAEQGILVCTTGIGMSIAANKFPRVRAALCLTPDMAAKARMHNDANVLVLGGALTPADAALGILDAWLDHSFEHTADRHRRRVGKLVWEGRAANEIDAVLQEDPELAEMLHAETERERLTINLIASENYVGAAVRQAQGSYLTNKYAEGYPAKRWYNGCGWVDRAESLAIERARSLFGAEHANVQPHSGSNANMAVYFAALDPGDTILAMSLAHGGHLTHGHNVNFSGRLYNVVAYGVDRETERIDYGEIRKLAREYSPAMLVAGASAYPRLLDFEALHEIAGEVGARLMVDMAHIAGLVAGGAHPSPVPLADYVTSTTHKTLRGPRAGLILCREDYAADVDRQVFPGTQGGPFMHTIAAKAVCFHEAAQPAFQQYAENVVKNARAMAEALAARGFRLVSGGTDNHLMLVDLTPMDLTGKDAANVLEDVGIVVNKNAIPFDTRSPFVTSGIRIGTPSITTRGMNENDARTVAGLLADVLLAPGDEAVRERTRGAVRELAASFPLP